MHQFWYGTLVDYKIAQQWCIRSTDQGNSNAQNSTGNLFYEGNGFQKIKVNQYFDIKKLHIMIPLQDSIEWLYFKGLYYKDNVVELNNNEPIISFQKKYK